MRGCGDRTPAPLPAGWADRTGRPGRVDGPAHQRRASTCRAIPGRARRAAGRVGLHQITYPSGSATTPSPLTVGPAGPGNRSITVRRQRGASRAAPRGRARQPSAPWPHPCPRTAALARPPDPPAARGEGRLQGQPREQALVSVVVRLVLLRTRASPQLSGAGSDGSRHDGPSRGGLADRIVGPSTSGVAGIRVFGL